MGQQQIGSLYAKIGAEMGDFKSAMHDVKRDMDQATDNVKGGGEKMQKSLDGVTTKAGGMKGAFGDIVKVAGGFAAFFGAAGAVNALSGAVTGAIQSAAKFETYQVQFGVLLGSVDKAQERLEELSRFGAETPFELPGVVEADKILQGFGLHSQEAAKKFGYSGAEIRRIAGDVAAGSGASFQEMAGYIGKFSSGATGEAIARFQEMGIVTREQLKGMGLEFAKSGELMSPLPEATNVLLTIMKEKYGGMMDAQSKTLEGMWSNLQDWIGNMQRTLAQPLFEIVKDKLAVVLTFLDTRVKPALEMLTKDFGKGMEMIASAFGELAGKIAGKLPDIISRIGKWLVTEGLPAMARFGKELADKFALSLVQGMSEQAVNINASIAQLMWSAFGQGAEFEARRGMMRTKESVMESIGEMRDSIDAKAGVEIPNVFARAFDSVKNAATTGLAGTNVSVQTALEAMNNIAKEGTKGFVGYFQTGIDQIAKAAWMAAAFASGIQFAPEQKGGLQGLIDDAGKYGFTILNIADIQKKADEETAKLQAAQLQSWNELHDRMQTRTEKFTDALGVAWDVNWDIMSGKVGKGGAAGGTGGSGAAGALEVAIGTATDTWVKDVEIMSLSIQELPNDSWAAFDTIRTESTKETRSMWDAIKVHTGIGILETVGKWTGFWTSLKSETDIGVAQVIASLNPLFIALQSLTFARNSATAPVTGASVTTGGVVDLTGSSVMAGPSVTATPKQETVLQVDGRTFARLIGPYLDNRVRITA